MPTYDPSNSTNELLIRFANGDQHSFALLYKQWFRQVYYFATRFVSNAQDAEDITSSAFQKLWLQRTKVTSSDHLRSFLFTTTRNACIDFLRTDKRRADREEALWLLQQQEDPTAFNEQEYIRELMDRIDREVDKLPEQTARIFRMAFIEGRKNAEIASLLNIGEHTVRNQKSLALKQLRLSLQYGLLPALFFFPGWGSG